MCTVGVHYEYSIYVVCALNRAHSRHIRGIVVEVDFAEVVGGGHHWECAGTRAVVNIGAVGTLGPNACAAGHTRNHVDERVIRAIESSN